MWSVKTCRGGREERKGKGRRMWRGAREGGAGGGGEAGRNGRGRGGRGGGEDIEREVRRRRK